MTYSSATTLRRQAPTSGWLRPFDSKQSLRVNLETQTAGPPSPSSSSSCTSDTAATLVPRPQGSNFNNDGKFIEQDLKAHFPTQPKPTKTNPHLSPQSQPSSFHIKRLKAGISNPYCDFTHAHPLHSSGKIMKHRPNSKRVAQFEIIILGYPVYLCLKCLVHWKQDWDTALSDIARTGPTCHPLIHDVPTSSS